MQTPNHAVRPTMQSKPYFLLLKNPRFFFSVPSSFAYLFFFSSLPLLPPSLPLVPFVVMGRPLPEFMLKAASPAVGGTGGGVS
jgi:hypothetical protein